MSEREDGDNIRRPIKKNKSDKKGAPLGGYLSGMAGG